MAEETNLNQTFDPNRPRLKKVKRPIKRVIPQSTPLQASPFTSTANKGTEISKFNDADINFNLDSYATEKKTNIESSQIKPSQETPHFIDDSELDAEYGVHRGELPAFLTKNVLLILAAVIFLFGFLVAKLFFADHKIVRNGLQGVVMNPEVPQGRARCGIAEKTQGCVLYIMNPQRQELNARDFYDLAAQLTGRQRFVIETSNMRYSNVKIRPGDIVQLNIPPL